MKTSGNRNGTYIRSDRADRKRRRNARRKLLVTVLILIVCAGIVFSINFIYRNYLGGGDSKVSSSAGSGSSASASGSEAPTEIPTPATPTVEPTTAVSLHTNPILLSGSFTKHLAMGSILKELLPSTLRFSSQIYINSKAVTAYQRSNPIALYDPAEYNSVPGVLTFRGNNFRNAPSFGYADIKEKKLAQIWERSMGGMASSRWDFSWSGTGWTGQPVMVQWDEEVRLMMNLYDEKRNKTGLIEVITAAMDGNIYFYDLEDGKSTRPAINIGVAVKGTPSIDPRGYPILYVGQGDYPPNDASGKMGFRIFSLIDQKLMYFKDTWNETRSYRNSWGAMDSSPIIDGKADTLVYPCENGMIYTAKLNTVFDKAGKKISITPEFVDYRYKSSATASQGIESSIAVYGSYGYFDDNSGTINCVDLNTMKPVWSRHLDDDNDVTPTLQQEGDRLYLYCGTEVDNQKSITGTYKGNAYIYKIDAMTGEVVWRNSYPAYTYNDVAKSGNDINGGIMGSFIVGKGKYSGVVIASICMTEGYSSGNTIAAFDTATGDLIWDYKMIHYSWGSPVDVYTEDGSMYILMTDSISQVHLIDGSNGVGLDYIQIKHDFNGAEPTGGGNIESSAAVFGNILVIGTRGGVLAGVRIK
ncbi:MAG: outer membrane protein assembly factor BamB family protein [Saccharofermentanales bacterium]